MPKVLRHTLLALVVGWTGLWSGLACADDSSFSLAAQRYRQGDWREAAALFADCLTDDKHSEQHSEQHGTAAHFYLAECQMQLGEYGAARDIYRKVLGAGEKSFEAPALFRAGEAAWLLGDAAEAQVALQQFVREHPQDRSAAYAINYLDDLAIEAEKLLDEAAGLQRDGRFDAALAAFHKLIDLGQASSLRAEALRRGARLHQRLNQHQEARRLFEQLLREFPTSPHTAETIAGLASIHDSEGKTSKARTRRRELVAKFPQSAQAPEAAYWLARAAADEKDSALAAQYVAWLLDELETRESPTARQRQLWAQAVCLQCQLDAAEKRWQVVEDTATGALEQLPQGADQVRVEFWLAEAEFRTGRFDEARSRFGQLEERTVGIVEAWVAMVPLRRAQLAARRQQWTEVLRFVERIDGEHPDFPLQDEVDYLRGRALAGRGEMTAARVAYGRVLNSETTGDSETAAMAQWMIGETFFHQSNYVQARAAYLAVIERQASADWQARAALQVGKCWELENRWDEAQAMYLQALQRWPGTEPEPQLQARLKWAESRTNTRR